MITSSTQAGLRIGFAEWHFDPHRLSLVVWHVKPEMDLLVYIGICQVSESIIFRFKCSLGQFAIDQIGS